MAVRDLADMLDDPHLRQTGFFTRRAHPTRGDFWEMAAPVSFGRGGDDGAGARATGGGGYEGVKRNGV